MYATTPNDPPDADQLRYLGLSAPADLDMQLGYDTSRDLFADNRYVAFYWTPAGDELIVTDGFSSSDGHWRNFQQWDHDAGRQMLKLAAKARDDMAVSPEDIDAREYVPPLTNILRDQGYEIGSSDTMGNSSFLLDRDTGDIYVGERTHVKQFCQRFNDGPPEWVEELPDDPETLQRLFERLSEELNDEDDDTSLFGDEGE